MGESQGYTKGKGGGIDTGKRTWVRKPKGGKKGPGPQRKFGQGKKRFCGGEGKNLERRATTPCCGRRLGKKANDVRNPQRGGEKRGVNTGNYVLVVGREKSGTKTQDVTKNHRFSGTRLGYREGKVGIYNSMKDSSWQGKREGGREGKKKTREGVPSKSNAQGIKLRGKNKVSGCRERGGNQDRYCKPRERKRYEKKM